MERTSADSGTSPANRNWNQRRAAVTDGELKTTPSRRKEKDAFETLRLLFLPLSFSLSLSLSLLLSRDRSFRCSCCDKMSALRGARSSACLHSIEREGTESERRKEASFFGLFSLKVSDGEKPSRRSLFFDDDDGDEEEQKESHGPPRRPQRRARPCRRSFQRRC